MSLSPIYDTHPPAHTESSPPSRRQFHHSPKPVSATAKPLGSVPPFSRQVFSVQDGARQKLNICPEPSGNKLSESVFKNSVRCL
jgi:hypothetical protein